VQVVVGDTVLGAAAVELLRMGRRVMEQQQAMAEATV